MFSVFKRRRKRRVVRSLLDMHAAHRALNMIASLQANGNSEPDTMADALDFASAVAYVALHGDGAAVDRITGEYLENGARDALDHAPTPFGVGYAIEFPGDMATEKFSIHIPPKKLSAADRAKGFTLGPLIPDEVDRAGHRADHPNSFKKFRARILRK